VVKLIFSHVGLCALVTGYAVAGAFIFRELELPYEKALQGRIAREREKLVDHIYDYVSRQTIIRGRSTVTYGILQ